MIWNAGASGPTPQGRGAVTPGGWLQASHKVDGKSTPPSTNDAGGSTANRLSRVVAPGATSGGSARTASTRSLSMKLADGRSDPQPATAPSATATATATADPRGIGAQYSVKTRSACPAT